MHSNEAETPEDFWRRSIETEKECNFESITAEELLISKFMTAKNQYREWTNLTHEREINPTTTDPCRFCNAPNWNQSHKCPALDQTCNNCGKKGHFVRACRQKENYKRKIRNVTENENSTIGEESDESESSIYRIERINRIVYKNKYLTTTVKINGTEKEFIIDT